MNTLRSGRRLCPISAKLGMTRATLRRWVRRAQVDWGMRSGVTAWEREPIRELERVNTEIDHRPR